MNKSNAILSGKNGLYPRNYRILIEVKIVYGFKIIHILSDMPIIFSRGKRFLFTWHKQSAYRKSLLHTKGHREQAHL